MKSKFAKFTDATLGAILIFAAAYAVLIYFTLPSVALFCAISITLTLSLILRAASRRKDRTAASRKSTEDMFYDFMFLPDDAPIKLLAKGLKARGLDPTVRGKGLYVGKTAAFAQFDAPLELKSSARMIARARRYGCDNVIAICKLAPAAEMDVDGVRFTVVHGDEVYALFASLGVLPEHKFDKPRRSKLSILRAVLSRDKIMRYALLSAALFAVSVISRFSVIPLVCAILCAALCLASMIMAIVKSSKKAG